MLHTHDETEFMPESWSLTALTTLLQAGRLIAQREVEQWAVDLQAAL
jgi:hypothetical protein